MPYGVTMSTDITVVLCANCGRTNPRGFNYCGWCSTSLETGWQPEASPDATQTLRVPPRVYSPTPPRSKQRSRLSRILIGIVVLVGVLVFLTFLGQQKTSTVSTSL